MFNNPLLKLIVVCGILGQLRLQRLQIDFAELPFCTFTLVLQVTLSEVDHGNLKF